MCDILKISRFVFEMVNGLKIYVVCCIALMKIGIRHLQM
jgi:hypothetical protein